MSGLVFHCARNPEFCFRRIVYAYKLALRPAQIGSLRGVSVDFGCEFCGERDAISSGKRM